MQKLDEAGRAHPLCRGAHRPRHRWSRRSPSCRWRSSSATSRPAPSPSATACRRASNLKLPTIEFSYKNDDLGDPLINDLPRPGPRAGHPRGDRDTITELRLHASTTCCKEFFLERRHRPGRLQAGVRQDRRRNQIVLADEICPDTCRFWDAKTHEKLDKDRFRRDLGGVGGGLQEMRGHVRRITEAGSKVHGRFLRRLSPKQRLRAGPVLRHRLPLPSGHPAGRHGGLRPRDRLPAANPQH